MALFKRNKDQTVQSEVQVPAEIQEYYQAERRERAGVAWLLALGTLVVTLLLAVGLFFGGRWVYRKTTHKNTSTAKTNTSQSSDQSTPDNTSSSSTSSSTDQSSSSNSSASSSASTPTSNSSSAPAASSSTATPSQTSTGSSSNSLPNTGPGDVLAIFAITAIAGALAHRLLVGRHVSRLK